MTEKHILIIGGFRFMHQYMQNLPNVTTSLLHYTNKIRANDCQRNRYVLGAPSESEWLPLARALHQIAPIDAIACFDDETQHIAAQIGQALHIGYHSPETIAAVQNKVVMRRKLAAADLDWTAARPVESAQDIQGFAQEHGFPLILKPQDGQGSTGIAKIADQAAIAPALEAVRAASAAPLVVETMLQGPEFSVEAFSEGGEHQILTVTRKFKDPATFVEQGHVMPAELPERERAQIERFVTALLTALDVRSGPSHTELILTADGPQVVETHLRTGGDFIPEMLADISGVDMLALAARQLAGEAVLPEIRRLLAGPAPQAPYAAVHFRTDAVYGVLNEIGGVEAAQAMDGVRQVFALQSPQSAIRPARSSFERLAMARATGATAAEALERARAAAAALAISVVLDGQAVM
ncbi:MAG TPA: ATP-grasp domain-containing protein [Herpetosiphonaceae bacterium]|nr:ATP-grasp domain-containing protein [Herpetosiphonaceae bacterium]